MSVSIIRRDGSHAPDAEVTLKEAFRQAMRELASGVCVITVGEATERTGLTATSVSSLSTEPPRLLVCINQSSSTWSILQQRPVFGVNLLTDTQREIADRFAGRGGIKGEARYQGARWETGRTGAPLLADALAVIDCDVEETLIRHSNVIVIGRVRSARVGAQGGALTYWRGGYDRLGLPMTLMTAY